MNRSIEISPPFPGFSPIGEMVKRAEAGSWVLAYNQPHQITNAWNDCIVLRKETKK